MKFLMKFYSWFWGLVNVTQVPHSVLKHYRYKNSGLLKDKAKEA